MIVDSEGRDLLDELEQIDSAVEEGWFEFAFKIDLLGSRFNTLHVVGEVDEGNDVDGELAEDRANDVRIEDVGLWPFLREAFDGLGAALADAFVL